MARLLFNISGGLLLILLAWHVRAALIWGSWDQEGTGSLGFWRVFIDTVVHYGWIYGALAAAAVVSWLLGGGPKAKRKQPPG